MRDWIISVVGNYHFADRVRFLVRFSFPALNLDGGPVACQAIQLNGFERKTYGNWEMRIDNDDALLLLSLRGIPSAMPVVVAVFPK